MPKPTPPEEFAPRACGHDEHRSMTDTLDSATLRLGAGHCPSWSGHYRRSVLRRCPERVERTHDRDQDVPAADRTEGDGQHPDLSLVRSMSRRTP